MQNIGSTRFELKFGILFLVSVLWSDFVIDVIKIANTKTVAVKCCEFVP